jgi:uncharacterized protein
MEHAHHSLAFGQTLTWLGLSATEGGALLFALLLAGIVSGMTHCAGMCGPFVLAQTTAHLSARPASTMGRFTRLRGAALVPYHLGRLTTYTALGVAAGAIAGALGGLPGLRWLGAVMLALAAICFLLYALRGVTGAMPRSAILDRFVAPWVDLVSRLARPFFKSPLGFRGYGLGLALGLIPCGLLYGALAAAAATGSPLLGGAAMAAFAVGTAPGLVLVGIAGYEADRRWPRVSRGISTLLMASNAGIVMFLATQWIT